MNIGIVVPYFTPYVRGNEYGLAQSLVDLGHNITIITAAARAPREKTVINGRLRSERPDYSFNVNYLSTILDLGDNPVISSMNEHLKFQDFLMLQEDYPFICHSAYRAAKKYNIPTILSSERTYYPENPAKRYVLKVLDATVNKKLRNGVHALTAHCTAAREFMMHNLGVKRKITVIHVGMDTQLFRPLESSSKYLVKGSYKILTAARLHRYKGLNFLIEAMDTIREEIPDAHLYILGKGIEEKRLQNQIDKLMLNSAITFLTTSIPNHEMPKLYAECDVYAQPSVIEPYGIAVLEAMASGKPVVGTGIGGMRDTIVNGETGFLVPPKNSKELAERIIHLATDTALSIKMGKEARDRAVKRFDLEIIGRKYMELLNSLI